MDFGLLERIGALIVLVVGAVTGIVKIPDMILAISANKKKYQSSARNHYSICWTTIPIAWRRMNTSSRNCTSRWI